MRERLQRVADEKTNYETEYRIIRPSGEVRDLRVIGQPVFDSAGNLLEYVGTSTDITERKRAEEALRRSEAYLKEAQRLSQTGSWAFDVASNKYVYLTEECSAIFELDAQGDLPNREAVARLIHREDWGRVNEDFEKSVRDKVDTASEFRIVLPSGTTKHVQAIRHPVLNDAGELTELVGTVVDLTERKRAEETLRRSEAYLVEAQRLSHTGSWALDVASKTYEYWSKEMFRIYEFDPHEPLPLLETIMQRVHPGDRELVTAGIEKSIREKVDSSLEFSLALPSGTVKHVHVVRHPVLNDSGEVVTLLGALMDITERKRTEEALRRSEVYLNEAQRLAHTGSWAYDPAGGAIYWSEEMYRIYAMDPQKGPPTRAQRDTRLHPEDLENVRQGRYRLLHEKVESEFEYRIVLPDGTIRHVYVRCHPVLSPTGEVLETVGTMVDITERKRAEEALRESETRFRTFVDHATDAFFMLDFEQGTILDVNRPACESLGYTQEELVGKRPTAFHLDSEQAHIESVVERAAAGETVLDRHWHRRKDGRLFPVEASTSSFQYGSRRFLLKVARDISDRLRAEEEHEQLRQLEAELAHIDRVSMMGELAASIAHEVNQPLSGVVSNGSACLRWLAGDAPNLEEAREALSRIVRDGKRAGEVIARIRAMTKRAAATQEKLDLNETIREVLVLVGDEAKRNSVIMRTQFADDLSPVLGDRVQLQQVVLNLVMNGIEAMSSVDDRTRELVITTRNIDPEQVQVTVEDSG